MNWPEITYSLNPTWPEWLPQTAAIPTFLVAGLILALLTLWTYLGVRGARPGRVLLVLMLRLLALMIALLVALRPAFGVVTLEGLEPSRIVILIDASQSMSVLDGFDGKSRWDHARRLLASRDVSDALKRLWADEQIEAVYYQAADRELMDFTPQEPPVGKRTDVGGWLSELHKKHAGKDKLRAVLIFSDGADNGTSFSPLDEAGKWNTVCPIHTFGLGKAQDDSDRPDIIAASVKATPSPVPAKTKLTVTGLVHAPGFKDFVVEVELWIQGPGDAAPVPLGEPEKHQLKDERNNQITLVRDAPETAGEHKLIFKVKPVASEADVTNNDATTYVVVTKEGVSVLWVEGRKRPYEPIFAKRYALAGDKRFRVFEAEPGGEANRPRDFYEFEKRHYDVIVVGDLSARQFDGGDPAVLTEVARLVRDKKVGLFMLGGVDTFGRGGWQNTPLAELLPVKLDTDRQLDNPVRFKPSEAILKLPRPNPYPFLILDDDEQQNRDLWEKKFGPLDGMAYLGDIRDKERATVLATGNDDPLLVAWQPGGRVLVFGGDTTWKAWRRPHTLAAYNKFWRQAILWLANQDDRAGDLWIDVKSRKLNANSGDRLDFTFALEGKLKKKEVANARYTIEAIGPGGEVIHVPQSVPEKEHRRGSLPVPAAPGEYRLEIRGEGKDADGSVVTGKSTRHFVVVSENLEMQRLGADHELLEQIARKSGGRFAHADQGPLLKLLGDLKGQARQESHARTTRWPDWDRRPATDAWPDQLAGLWGSAAFLWFFAFALLLAGEWGLRRMWGMV